MFSEFSALTNKCSGGSVNAKKENEIIECWLNEKASDWWIRVPFSELPPVMTSRQASRGFLHPQDPRGEEDTKIQHESALCYFTFQ